MDRAAILFGMLLLPVIYGMPASWSGGRKIVLNEEQEAVFETFKHNLIRYYGVSESFADKFKRNLRRAVDIELVNKPAPGSSSIDADQSRQSPLDEEEDDDEDTTPVTTMGPSPFNIVNGIYGILMGVGTLNPDRVFQSTVNFFPPSQKQTAQALIDSALGQNPGTWPTTTPTTTKLTTSTKDPDDEDDEDEDGTTKAASIAVAATPQPVAQAVAPVVAGIPAASTATLAPSIEKYAIAPKATAAVAAQTASPVAQPSTG